MAISRQEEDELLARMEEDERLLDDSDGDDKLSDTATKERAKKAGRANSVGTLVKDFIKMSGLGQMMFLRHRHQHPPTALKRPPQAGWPLPLAQGMRMDSRGSMKW